MKMVKWVSGFAYVWVQYMPTKSSFGLVVVDRTIIAGFKAVPDHLVFHL